MKVQRAKRVIEVFILIIITVGPFSPVIKMGMYMVLMIMNIKYFYKLKKIKPIFLFIIASMVFAMLLDISNVDSATSYSMAGFAYLAPFIFTLLYVHDFDRDDFLVILEKELFFVSVISLAGFVVLLYAPFIIERFPTVLYYGRPVKTIILWGAIRNPSGVGFLHRNCGIAFEPGAFQIVPNLGLAFLSGNQRKEKDCKYWIRLAIYVLAVMTTYSSTGLVIMAIILGLSALSSRKQFAIMSMAGVAMSGLFLSAIRYQIGKMQTGNFIGRFERSFYVIKYYSMHFLGIGSTGYDKIYKYNPMIGSWDLYTNLYLRFGIAFTVLLIYLCIRLKRINLYVCITVGLSFLTESILGPLIVMLFYYSNVHDNKLVIEK